MEKYNGKICYDIVVSMIYCILLGDAQNMFNDWFGQSWQGAWAWS